MSTKFFTNDGDNTLINKLEGIFQHMDVYYFDAVIGYFRASGYFRIYNFLRDVEQIRFLVGINIDELTWKAHSRGLEFRANPATTAEKYMERLIKDIQAADYNKDVEAGMISFIDDITSGKIQIKAHPSKSLHAKVYIFRQQHYHPHASYGAVITGSSNLTEAGLEKNFEFNVELRDHDDIMFASETFDKLWEQAVPISPVLIAEAKKSTYLNPDFTPFELYIKFLIEYFGKSIEYDPNDAHDLPEGYMHLRYQQDAVNDGYRKLLKYNGFFLADVVGLGKTIVACQIAKQFYHHNGTRTHILVVHPPALKPNWEKTVHDFNIDNVVKFVSNGSLHKIKHPEDYDLIIVDEAHKFRSDTSDMFHNLQVLCKTPRRNAAPNGDTLKKVILVSATPLNNKPEDIRNLILLFQDGRNSNLEVSNLTGFFRPLIDRFNNAKMMTTEAARQEVKDIYEKIRNKVLESIIIRRTRTDILTQEEYKKDIDDQGLHFPRVEKPEPLYYKLDTQLNDLYERTMIILQSAGEGLKYYRYQAISNLVPHFKTRYNKAEDISRQLAFIMKTLLVKRLDSSFHSFVISLEKYRVANGAMITMFRNNAIHIAPSLHVSEFIVNGKEDELIAKMEILKETDPSVVTYDREAFVPGFEEGLKHDQELLDRLCEEWKNWQQNHKDPKLEELNLQLKSRLLNAQINTTGKLVIFSEYKDTTDYLKIHLTKAGYRLLAVDSGNVTELGAKIAANFDARQEPAKQANDYDLIITTEVLAEGVNLHRSHTILNYDTPWNSTKLMQRIGRVNRIGTTAEKIHIYNFYPTEQTEKDINLKKKAVLKLQAFHSALGEDSQIYSSEEEYGSFGLFDKEPKEERDERLEYLLELRQFRRDNPEWYKTIQSMPKRARTGRESKRDRKSTVVYLKNVKRDGFYYVSGMEKAEEMTFLECAGTFKAFQSEKAHPMPEMHHAQVSRAIHSFEMAGEEERAAQRTATRFGPNEKKAISYLSHFARMQELQTEERELVSLGMEAIKEGKFQKLHREVNKIQKASEKATLKPVIIAGKILELLQRYPIGNGNGYPSLAGAGGGSRMAEPEPAYEEQEEKPVLPEKDHPEIIISESFL
jgi:superfamily II DNA/RNA helicase